MGSEVLMPARCGGGQQTASRISQGEVAQAVSLGVSPARSRSALHRHPSRHESGPTVPLAPETAISRFTIEEEREARWGVLDEFARPWPRQASHGPQPSARPRRASRSFTIAHVSRSQYASRSCRLFFFSSSERSCPRSSRAICTLAANPSATVKSS